jgi:CheY-like chemotaxis protein
MKLLKGRRIFYVEDDLMNLTLTQAILEAAGATFASDRWMRETTVSRLVAFMPVDMILLDLMFPNNITGYDIFDTIRQNPAFDSIPVVAVSASDPAIEVPKTQRRGFAGFIGKPINLHRFPRLLAQILDGEQLWDAD